MIMEIAQSEIYSEDIDNIFMHYNFTREVSSTISYYCPTPINGRFQLIDWINHILKIKSIYNKLFHNHHHHSPQALIPNSRGWLLEFHISIQFDLELLLVIISALMSFLTVSI